MKLLVAEHPYRYEIEAVHRRFGHSYAWRFGSFDDVLAHLPTVREDYRDIQVHRLSGDQGRVYLTGDEAGRVADVLSAHSKGSLVARVAIAK